MIFKTILLHPKTADKVKQSIDSLEEEIIKAFEITKRAIYKLKYLKILLIT